MIARWAIRPGALHPESSGGRNIGTREEADRFGALHPELSGGRNNAPQVNTRPFGARHPESSGGRNLQNVAIDSGDYGQVPALRAGDSEGDGNMTDKCQFPRCRNDATVGYIGTRICHAHWTKIADYECENAHAGEAELLRQVGLERVDGDVRQAVTKC